MATPTTTHLPTLFQKMNSGVMPKSNEPEIMSLIARQITDVVKKDGELSALATQVTSMGYRMRCLGMDTEQPSFVEAGDHLYKIGCDLQAIAIIHMKSH